MHVEPVVLQQIDRPIPAIRRLDHALRVDAGLGYLLEPCSDQNTVGAHDGNGKPLTPKADPPPLPDPTTPPEGCSAGMGQPAADCTFTATHEGGIGGYASEPGGWTVTIERAGRDAIVVHGFTGATTYGCGIIEPGDVVHAEANDGSYVSAGNPRTCD